MEHSNGPINLYTYTTEGGHFRPNDIGKSSSINENLTAVGNSFESLYADGSALRRKKKKKKKAADAVPLMKDVFVFTRFPLSYIDFLQRGVNAHVDWIFAF